MMALIFHGVQFELEFRVFVFVEGGKREANSSFGMFNPITLNLFIFS